MISDFGTGAPPQSNRRRDERSAFAHLGDSVSAANIVGTPKSNVTRMRCDRLDDRVRIEPRFDDEVAALEQRRQAGHVERGGVEHRRSDECHLVAAQIEVDEHVEAVPHDVVVREDRALRAGRSCPTCT